MKMLSNILMIHIAAATLTAAATLGFYIAQAYYTGILIKFVY